KLFCIEVAEIFNWFFICGPLILTISLIAFSQAFLISGSFSGSPDNSNKYFAKLALINLRYQVILSCFFNVFNAQLTSSAHLSFHVLPLVFSIFCKTVGSIFI